MAILNQLNYGQKIDIALASDNYLIKFAVIWMIMNYGNHMHDLYLLDTESYNLSKLIFQFSKNLEVWEEFVKFLFNKITMNINLHYIVQALGKASGQIEPCLVHQFFERLPISNYTGYENITNNITGLISSINPDNLQADIYKKSFLRWEAYREFKQHVIN